MEKAIFFKIWEFNIRTFQFSCRVEQITAIKLWSMFSSQLLSYPVMLKIIYLQVRGVLSNVVSQTLTRFGRYITRTCLIICVKIIMSVRYGCRFSQKTHRVEYKSFNALLWLEITFFKKTFFDSYFKSLRNMKHLYKRIYFQKRLLEFERIVESKRLFMLKKTAQINNHIPESVWYNKQGLLHPQR